MGCPYNSTLLFGIEVSGKRVSKLQKQLENASEEELGDDFEPEVWVPEHFDEDEDINGYMSLVEVADVDNCGYVTSVDENLEKSKKQAIKTFNNTPFLVKNFKEKDIKLLLICNYCG